MKKISNEWMEGLRIPAKLKVTLFEHGGRGGRFAIFRGPKNLPDIPGWGRRERGVSGMQVSVNEKYTPPAADANAAAASGAERCASLVFENQACQKGGGFFKMDGLGNCYCCTSIGGDSRGGGDLKAAVTKDAWAVTVGPQQVAAIRFFGNGSYKSTKFWQSGTWKQTGKNAIMFAFWIKPTCFRRGKCRAGWVD